MQHTLSNTATGDPAGTFAYAAPEMLMGEKWDDKVGQLMLPLSSDSLPIVHQTRCPLYIRPAAHCTSDPLPTVHLPAGFGMLDITAWSCHESAWSG